MLRRIKVTNFKSLRNVEINLPQLTVLFGPNAAGKSNTLDAILLLSRIGTQRTLFDAFSYPFSRGYPAEAFSFPPGGLAELLTTQPKLRLEADIAVRRRVDFRYCVEVSLAPRSGALSITDEFLCELTRTNQPLGNPRIERVQDHLAIRRKGKGGRGREEPLNQVFSVLSDARWNAPTYRAIEQVRDELFNWRAYYLDPRNAMRWPEPPQAVTDIGLLGENLAPFLYRLRAEHEPHFRAVVRTLRAIVPSVDDVSVELDERQGTLDIRIKQAGIDCSSRIISEGTLRILALCAIAVNPWSAPLVAFEEPENGVHPRRIELIAELLYSLVSQQGRQLVVTTHSPLFCDAMLRKSLDPDRRSASGEIPSIGLLRVAREGSDTKIAPFNANGPLFQDEEVRDALTSGSEDGLFESLMLRGFIDE